MTPEMMMGNGGAQPAPEQTQDSSGDVNDQLRQLIMQIGQVAQRVPEAQQECQAAAQALTAASLKVVAGQREPPQGQAVIAS